MMSFNAIVDHRIRIPPQIDSARIVSLTVFAMLLLPFCAGPISSPEVTAGGSQEAAGMDRAGHIVSRQRIVRSEEIRIDAYISGVDYGYPDPEGDVGITLFLDTVSTPDRSAGGSESAILQIGIQGRRIPFGELPPMNLVFLLDTSGSMSGEGKIEAGREAFRSMLRRLRDEDIVSVVVFAEEASVIVPPIRLAAVGSRDSLAMRLSETRPYGRSNLGVGLETGYAQAVARYGPGMVNRVILVSDGNGVSSGTVEETVAEMIEEYRDAGIGLTTVTVGTTVDVAGMSALARAGGGSSRFAGDAGRASELFDTGFDRMIVAAASDLEVLLHPKTITNRPIGPDMAATWGYDHRYTGDSIRYTIPSLHVRDYETIVVELGDLDSNFSFTLTVRYRDWKGRDVVLGPFDETHLSNLEQRERLEKHPIHTRAAVMLRFAQGLKDIGVLYYSVWDDFQYLYTTQNRVFDVPYLRQETALDVVAEREYEELSRSIEARRRRALEIVIGLFHQVHSARNVLGEAALQDEEAILRTYSGILSRELMLDPEEANMLQAPDS